MLTWALSSAASRDAAPTVVGRFEAQRRDTGGLS